MKDCIALVLAVLVLSPFMVNPSIASDLANTPITKENWMKHPDIVEVRQLYQQIKKSPFEEKKKNFEYRSEEWILQGQSELPPISRTPLLSHFIH